jgi:hypothetical protein
MQSGLSGRSNRLLDASACRRKSGAGLGSGFYAAMTDGVLRKDELLKSIERLHSMDASKVHSDVIAALREFETLIIAWNGEGAPPEMLTAWATSFLARLSNDESSSA